MALHHAHIPLKLRGLTQHSVESSLALTSHDIPEIKELLLDCRLIDALKPCERLKSLRITCLKADSRILGRRRTGEQHALARELNELPPSNWTGAEPPYHCRGSVWRVSCKFGTAANRLAWHSQGGRWIFYTGLHWPFLFILTQWYKCYPIAESQHVHTFLGASFSTSSANLQAIRGDTYRIISWEIHRKCKSALDWIDERCYAADG